MLHKRDQLSPYRALVRYAREPRLRQPNVASDGLTAGARRGPPRQDRATGYRRSHDVALWVDAEEVSRQRPCCADCLPGRETVIGQERDLIRESADDIGAGHYPHTVGDGIGETVAESSRSSSDRLRNSGSGERRSRSTAQSVGVHAPPRVPSASISEWLSAFPCSIEPRRSPPVVGRLDLAPVALAARLQLAEDLPYLLFGLGRDGCAVAFGRSTSARASASPAACSGGAGSSVTHCAVTSLSTASCRWAGAR
jgi:hypothetical protein